MEIAENITWIEVIRHMMQIEAISPKKEFQKPVKLHVRREILSSQVVKMSLITDGSSAMLMTYLGTARYGGERDVNC